MIYEVFSVFDEKADAFLPPFILPRIAQAKRVFADCVNSDDHQFGAHPSDYTLFRLGQFDDAAGQFLLERSKQSLGNGVEFLSYMDSEPAKEGQTNGETDPSVEKISNESSVFDGSSGDHTKE